MPEAFQYDVFPNHSSKDKAVVRTLAVSGASEAVRLMQQYRLQATEVNDMLRLQLPCKRRGEVEAVVNELFRRKNRFYEELAMELKANFPP